MSEDLGRVSVTSSQDGRIATITVDRERKLNAFTPHMVAELGAVAAGVAAQRPRVVLLRTAGRKVFCVGADITPHLDR